MGISSPSIEALVKLVEVFSPNQSLNLSFLCLESLSIILPNREIPGNFNFSVLFKVPLESFGSFGLLFVLLDSIDESFPPPMEASSLYLRISAFLYNNLTLNHLISRF